MLIQTLRKLEHHGLVARHDHGEVPPRVEYRLTVLGASLSAALEPLQHWLAHNLPAPVAPSAPEQRHDEALDVTSA